MAKRKVKHVQEVAHSEEQRLPDSGYGSDNIQPPALKRPALVTTAEKVPFEDVQPPAAPRAAVKVMSDQTLLVTPKRVKTDWLHDHGPSSDPPQTPWRGSTSSPDFDVQKYESPSLNHGKHRTAAKPNRHFDRHLTAPIRNQMLHEYQALCTRSQAEALKGLKKLRKVYAEHTEYIDQVLVEHVFELQCKVSVAWKENATLKQRNAVLEADAMDH